MAALMQSVKVARVLTSRHYAVRSLYHSNRAIENHRHISFIPCKPYIFRMMAISSRPCSSLAPDMAIIEHQQGRPNQNSLPKQRNSNMVTPLNKTASPQTIPEIMDKLRELTTSKSGITSPGMINRVLRLIKTDGSTLKASDSVLLLECTGQALIFTPKERRVQVMETILAKYEEVGIALTTEHYNAILQSQSDNGVKFNPIEFLTNMEAKKVSPNRITYQFLISKFCQDGNVEAASEILQHMKQASIPVTEAIFSSFITGYMRTGNTEKAKEVLEIMSQSGIRPTGRSYSSLLTAFAEKGDIEGIRETLARVRRQRIEIEDQDVYAIVMALAQAGHQQYIPEILEILVERGNSVDGALVVRSIREFIVAGHEQVALEIFQSLNRTNPNLMVIPMIAAKKSLLAIIDIANKLDEHLFTQPHLDYLSKFISSFANAALGIQLLDFFQSKGLVVHAQSVRRILSKFRGFDCVEPIYQAAALLSKIHGEDVASLVYDASRAIQHLLQQAESVENITAKLQALTYPESELPVMIFLGYLRSGQFQLAAQYGEGNSACICGSSAINSSLLKEVMLQGYGCSGRNLDAMLDAIKMCNDLFPFQAHQLSSDVLLKLVSFKDFNPEAIEKFLRFIEENNLKVLMSFKSKILKELGAKQVPSQVVAMLDKVILQGEKAPGLVQMKEMATSELEKLLPSLKQNRANLNNACRLLILRYCAEKNTEETSPKIEEIVQKLESNNFWYDFTSLNALVGFYGQSKKDLPRTLKFFNELTAKYRNYKDTFRLVLIVATLQAENGLTSDALMTIQDHLDAIESSETQSNTKTLTGNCVELLNAMPTKEDVDHMYSLLVKGFVDPSSFQVMKAMIMADIRLNKRGAVVRDLVKFSEEYNIDPDQELFDAVLGFFIERKDFSRLQKILSIFTASKGPIYVQHALLKQLLHQDKVEEAEKALKRFQPAPNMALMNRICNSFLREGNVKAMTELLRITKDMEGVDREQMIFWLLKLHVKQENSTAALETFVLFQEENITPQRRTLRTVGELLNSLHVTALPAELLNLPETKPEEARGMKDGAESEHPPEVPVKTTTTESNQVSELISRLKACPDLVEKYCIKDNLRLTAKHCPELAKQLEMTVVTQPKPSSETVHNLVQYFLEAGRLGEAQTLMMNHSGNLSKPTDLFNAMPESMLLETKSIFGPKDGAAMFDRLVMLKLETGDWQGGLQYYKDALKEDFVLSEDTLTVLETMLRIHDQPIPW